MLQSRRELNLATEAIDVDSGCKVWRQNLDDYLPVELGLRGDEHARHARAAKLAVDPIGSAEHFLELGLEIGGHARI
jgi:hypothetical protein